MMYFVCVDREKAADCTRQSTLLTRQLEAPTATQSATVISWQEPPELITSFVIQL